VLTVTRMAPILNSGTLQRKCACGQHTAAGEQCEDCTKKKVLQRYATSSVGPAIAPPIVHDVLRSSGQPLDRATRDFMEPRFGHDFSHVRVHTDDLAAQSARSVGALAYTVGKNVVFGRSRYAPRATDGQRLLAHELTHTIQQNGPASHNGIEISANDTPQEKQAELIADVVVDGKKPNKTMPLVSEQLQREPMPDAMDEEAAGANEPEQADDGEAHDGDSPVIVSAEPEAPNAQEAGSPVETVLALAGPEQEPLQEQRGSAGKPSDPKQPDPNPPAQKKPTAPRTITSIDVDLTSQNMTVHYSDGTSENHKVASGKGRPGTKDDPCKTQTEENCTPTGDFKIGSKGNENTKNSHGDAMAWFVELTGDKVIDGRGIGIHDSQPTGGGPRSHGCIRVGDSKDDKAFAKKINSGVTKTTTVHVTGKAATKPWSAPPKKKSPKSAPSEKK
jgi:lipoprotein-anchoring transpeptidase ErfK/SrfK